MIQKDIAIVFDCGATNVRVIAMNKAGEILAAQSFPNETDDDPNYPGGRIWDLEKMWGKLCRAALKVTSEIDTQRIAGATVTTFGVDGTFVSKEGDLLYPVISWQCARTQPIMDSIDKYIPLNELFQISGVYPYPFNTINKMVWFKENRPNIIAEADQFLFITSLLIHKLTGEKRNDSTMAGTSMMLDLKNRQFSNEIHDKLGLDTTIWGSLAEPGEQAGTTHETASQSTGIPQGIPVYFAGHDTQFAIFGSGAELNQPVLSSGTWEILMARTKQFSATESELSENLTTEADSQPGIFNIGQNWLGSGVLEWFSRNFYPDLTSDKLYETMIADAEQIAPGTHGLKISPSFYKENENSEAGIISGLTVNTSRAQIYRALLESLAFRLFDSLKSLQNAGNFKAEQIICVGGGSKNKLWNQIRADVCNLPIHLIDQKETTVLGAALFVFAGSGLFSSVEEARKNINYRSETITPSENSKKYQDLYQQYQSWTKKNN
ncbi:L-fuculokinase [Mangrovibacterium sp.]|uniref:L-fuculokinase n=1 Tax=Mangrovibacterium sp. TaxID=1961364 RepID=UPI00356299ED